jgi:hypothetical protein
MSSNSTLVSAWVLGDVGKIIEDQEIEAIEAVDGGLEVELAPRHLELLDEIGSADEEDAR